jgi:multiple sugar transport system substrate-binding protein
MKAKTLRITIIVLITSIATSMLAHAQDDFDWRAHEGEPINLLLSQHPYQAALVQELDEFVELTGIEITLEVLNEEEYFDVVTADLALEDASQYDVFMTGAYMIWQYAPQGWMEPLEGYIEDPTRTNPDYDFDDIFPDLTASERWNLEPGRQNLGLGSQYAIPWGFETNTLMYRQDLFTEQNLPAPVTFDELVETAIALTDEDAGVYGIAVRGTESWATIHPGFMTAYASQGCIDFDEDMVPQMNSPCAVEFTEKWAELVAVAGPDDWFDYTWYRAGGDFGEGEAAMLFDADIVGFFRNQPGIADSEVLGNIATAPGPTGPDGERRTNIWIWSLAMNANSDSKDAAWYFMQWATGKEFLTEGALDYTLVNPVRQSIWDNPQFINRMQFHTNYVDSFNTVMAGDARIQFTPQPLFFETTTEWAAALQDIYAAADDSGDVETEFVQQRLDELVEEISALLEEAGVVE